LYELAANSASPVAVGGTSVRAGDGIVDHGGGLAARVVGGSPGAARGDVKYVGLRRDRVVLDQALSTDESSLPRRTRHRRGPDPGEKRGLGVRRRPVDLGGGRHGRYAGGGVRE